jgi:hypothetical protein
MSSHTESLIFWDNFLGLRIYEEAQRRYERVVKVLEKEGINDALNGNEIYAVQRKLKS